MKVARINTDELERCEGAISEQTRKYRYRMSRDPGCDLPAKFLVDNKPMCPRHAGYFVLKYALERGEI